MAATTTIDQLPAGAALDGTEPFAIVQAGGTKKTTGAAIAQYVAGSGQIGGLVVPCTCATTGANIALTPIANLAQAVASQQQFSAIADATPSGPITATVNGTGPLPVYIGGVQAPEGAIVVGDYFALVCDSALNGGAGGFVLLPSGATAPRVITAAGPLTIAASDSLVIINQTAPAALAITLPDPTAKFGPVIIKDWAGVAGTYNFTISGATIDGQSSFVMNANFQSLGLRPVPGLGYAIT